MMRTHTNRNYQKPETTGGDMDTPVTFFRKTDGGRMPGQGGKEPLYFCMCELYQASIKDYDIVNTDNAEYVVTILIPHPREDYIPKLQHRFEVEALLYQGATFEVQSIAPKDKRLLKIVGVAYGS